MPHIGVRTGLRPAFHNHDTLQEKESSLTDTDFRNSLFSDSEKSPLNPLCIEDAERVEDLRPSMLGRVTMAFGHRALHFVHVCRPFRAWMQAAMCTGVSLSLHPGLWSASPSGLLLWCPVRSDL